MTKLSVIVPAFRQEKTICKDLANIESVLRQIRHDYEIICVVDGFLDKTYSLASRKRSNRLKVCGYEQNRGKGYAVRYGMSQAKGELIAFIDAGMDIDPNGISMLLEHMEWYKADIIIGSKRHPASLVNYPLTRRLFSIGYQYFVRLLFGLKVRDTQTGLKIYKREVLEKVLPRMLVKKFAFDIEILVVSKHLGFKRIYEAPVKINTKAFISNSTVRDFNKLIKASWVAIIDTLAVFYRLYLCKYYENKNWRAWKAWQARN